MSAGAIDTGRCDQCGASYQPGADCDSCFHALLAYEYERPPAFGAVHHLTVATFYLQHPRGYTTEALRFWHSLVAEAMDGRTTPRELLRRAGQRFGGATRVRDPGATPPAWWPREWPMTIQAVFRPEDSPSMDGYVARAQAWATATRRVLDQLEVARST